MEKTLSIFMPTYNRCELAAKQMKFLLKEMHELNDEQIRVVEFVICDNNSSDETFQKLKRILSSCSYRVLNRVRING